MDRELLLLGLLRRGDMHGYRLIDFIERELSTCTDLKKSTAYFVLDKMVAQGWITRSEEREGNRPPRRVYHITAAGEAQFLALLRENLARHAPPVFGGDIGLAFLDAVDPGEAIELLALRRAALVADLEAARAVPPHAGAWQLLIDHRVIHLEGELSWLDDVLARLASA